MKVKTYLCPAEVDPARVSDAIAVVIDVVRATSTMVEALAAGAKAIYPTVSTDDAIRLANSLGREDTLLCGERKGLKIEGFDLGNSPAEFTPDRVGEKRLVMSTTNGTRALLAAEDAKRVLCASLLNLSAVTRALDGAERLIFICAGKEDRFSLDDALCAGLLIRGLTGEDGEAGEGRDGEAGHGWEGRAAEVELDDASRAALALTYRYSPTPDLLRETAAGAALVEVGLGDDLVHCAELDRHDLVPEMKDRMIHLPRRK